MAANWAPFERINNSRVEWPTGPITALTPGFAPTWVEAWVVQGTGTAANQIWQGPSQSTTQSSWSGFVPGQWNAAEPGWKSGDFSAGPAVGITLLATSNSGVYEFEWWVDPITLF